MQPSLDFETSFNNYMSKYKNWKEMFGTDQIKIFISIYKQIFEYEEHLNTVIPNNTVPVKMLVDAKSELERQKEVLCKMINNCIECNQYNVPRGTLTH